MSAIRTFDHIENKLYKQYFISRKRFCKSSREHATNLINFEKKKILPFTQKELKSHQNVKVCYICGKRFLKKFANHKDYWKVRDPCHYTGKYRSAAQSIYNLKFNVPNETL